MRSLVKEAVERRAAEQKAKEQKAKEAPTHVEPAVAVGPVVGEPAGITTFTCKPCGRVFSSPNSGSVIYAAKRHAKETGHKN